MLLDRKHVYTYDGSQQGRVALLEDDHNLRCIRVDDSLFLQEICSMMRRNADHVFQFMMAELGTEGSIDGNKRLVIRGKFVPKV